MMISFHQRLHWRHLNSYTWWWSEIVFSCAVGGLRIFTHMCIKFTAILYVFCTHIYCVRIYLCMYLQACLLLHVHLHQATIITYLSYYVFKTDFLTCSFFSFKKKCCQVLQKNVVSLVFFLSVQLSFLHKPEMLLTTYLYKAFILFSYPSFYDSGSFLFSSNEKMWGTTDNQLKKEE